VPATPARADDDPNVNGPSAGMKRNCWVATWALDRGDDSRTWLSRALVTGRFTSIRPGPAPA